MKTAEQWFADFDYPRGISGKRLVSQEDITEIQSDAYAAGRRDALESQMLFRERAVKAIETARDSKPERTD